MCVYYIYILILLHIYSYLLLYYCLLIYIYTKYISQIYMKQIQAFNHTEWFWTVKSPAHVRARTAKHLFASATSLSLSNHMTTHVFALMLFGDDSPRARCQEPWSLEIVIVAWILPCKTSRRIGSLVVKTQLQQHVMPPLARPLIGHMDKIIGQQARVSCLGGQRPVSLDVGCTAGSGFFGYQNSFC